MKNKYEIKQSYIIQLENEQLMERIKELIAEINKLKYEIKERERMVQDQRIDAVI